MRTKNDLFAELRKLLHDALMAQALGANSPRILRAQGLVDGYMRALLDGGVASQQEVLAVVAETRAALHGPATEASTFEPVDTAAA